MRNLMIVTLASAALLLPGLALAQNGDKMSTVEMLQHLEEKGYSDFGDVDRDFDEFEVEATSESGERVELEVDPKSGEILREERED